MLTCEIDKAVTEAALPRLQRYYKKLRLQGILKPLGIMPMPPTAEEIRDLTNMDGGDDAEEVDDSEDDEDDGGANEGHRERGSRSDSNSNNSNSSSSNSSSSSSSSSNGGGLVRNGWLITDRIPKHNLPLGYRQTKAWLSKECSRLRLVKKDSGIEGAGEGLYSMDGVDDGHVVCGVVGRFVLPNKVNNTKSDRMVQLRVEVDGKPVCFNIATNHPSAFINDGEYGPDADGTDSRVNCCVRGGR